jgi:desulfoferrodoxin-like iron-binding protein
MKLAHVDELIEKGMGFYSQNGRLNPYSILPGVTAPPHLHPNSDSFHYIIEGEGKFLVEDSEFPISQGMIVHVTPMTRYGIKNDSNQPIKILCIHCPLPPVFKEGDCFFCNKCGTEIAIIKAGVGSLVCCGVEMDRRHWDWNQNAMIVEKGVKKGDYPYNVDDEFTCKYCGTRIKIKGKGTGGPLLCCGFEL